MNPAEALELGRHAAFHGAPVVGIAPLQALLASGAAQVTEDEARWLLAVCQGASGLFGTALRTASSLRQDSDFAGEAHLVGGSIHRQLGHFDAAQRHDAQAATSPRESVCCEALIGLAADAIGAGEADAAANHLAQARGAWQSQWWREGIRLQWVSAELALLVGEAQSALPGLRDAAAVGQANAAPRHLAKTRGFLAVALRSARPGDPEACAEAMTLLAQATEAAQALAAWPLVWAFGRLQWLWLLEGLGQESAAAWQAQQKAARAVSLIVSDLPAEMRPAFRRRPDVADLLVGLN